MPRGNPIMQVKKFSDVNLDDPFFDSLKEGYAEFTDWFNRKQNETAYVFYQGNAIDGFMYLKAEHERLNDVQPPQRKRRYLKLGTFKINAHGTKLGERFLKKAIDHAIHGDHDAIYVTVFAEHTGLIALLTRYGFEQVGTKTTSNGTELVLVKDLTKDSLDPLKRFPLVKLAQGRHYVLGIYPDYHTKLFPDSILNNESYDIVEDVSHTNSIHKVYICRMSGVSSLRPGDKILIYRTSDRAGQAWFRSVATSACVVEDLKRRSDFSSFSDFLAYCRPHSVFSDDELRELYTEPRLYVIKMTYNAAFAKRVIRRDLIDMGFRQRAYWGFMPITRQNFERALEAGNVKESIIID